MLTAVHEECWARSRASGVMIRRVSYHAVRFVFDNEEVNLQPRSDHSKPMVHIVVIPFCRCQNISRVFLDTRNVRRKRTRCVFDKGLRCNPTDRRSVHHPVAMITTTLTGLVPARLWQWLATPTLKRTWLSTLRHYDIQTSSKTRTPKCNMFVSKRCSHHKHNDNHKPRPEEAPKKAAPPFRLPDL